MKKILIVEDHKETAKVVEEYLRMFFPKWIMYKAETGRSAIDSAIKDKPDVVVLDIALADDIDGMQVIREIAASGAKPRIILVTALGNRAFRGPRPGKPWIHQLEEHEQQLVAHFFEKTVMTWRDFITQIAKAANEPVPQGIEDL